MAISEAFEIKHATNLSEDDLNGHTIKLKTKTEDLFAIVETRTVWNTNSRTRKSKNR